MKEKITFPMCLPPRQLEFYYVMNRLFGHMQFKLQQRMMMGIYLTDPIGEMGLLLEDACLEMDRIKKNTLEKSMQSLNTHTLE